MATLILTLPRSTQGAPAEYDYVLTHDGQQATAQGRAVAALLPAPGTRGGEVVAVVPARALSWHRLRLPRRVAHGLLSARADAARVRAVLAGALEEQLLDDPAQLHFALFAAEGGIASDSADLWVAVCARNWLHAALAALEAAGRSVTRIVAQWEPVDGAAVAHVARDADASGEALVLAHPLGVSTLPLGAAAVALAHAHTALVLQAEPSAMAAAEQAFGQPAQAMTRAALLLQAAQSQRNLAQGELSASPTDRLRKSIAAWGRTVWHVPQWRPVRWGLLALVLLQVVALNALAWKEKSAVDAQRAALRDVLLQTFPQVQLVVDAPVQMQREVALLARSRGATSGLDWSAALAAAGAAQPGVDSLARVDFAGDALRLQFSGTGAVNLQALNVALAPLGLAASQDGDSVRIQRRGQP